MAGLKDKLAALATMSLAQLRTEWQRVYEASAPSVPPAMLRLGIAYKLQEGRRSGVPAALSRELVNIETVKGQMPRRPATPVLAPGSRLVRTWQGRTISVLATEDGFLFEDRCYSSLTRIACEVTNTKWSGPRFFGLTGNA